MKIRSSLAILSLLCISYAISFFHRVCPSVLAPELMKDFSLDAASFSILSSATMLGYAITQIPSGLLSDIIGGRKTLALYQCMAGTFCILFTFCDSLFPAASCRFFIGLALASNVPAYKILAIKVPAEKYAQYCSILTGCSALGAALAATPLVALCEITGWRMALMLAGLFTIFLGLLVITLLPGPGQGTIPASSASDNLRHLKSGLKLVVRTKNFWLIYLWFMFMIGNMFTLLTAWWGSYLIHGNGLSPQDAGLSMSIMSLAPLPFLLIIPMLSEKIFHSRRIFLLTAALIESMALGYICMNHHGQLSFTELTILGFLISLATTCMGPLSFTMVKESVPAHALATACGFLNLSGPVVSVLLQWCVGMIVSSHSLLPPEQTWAMAFLPLLIGSIIAFISSLFMKDTFNAQLS